MAQQGYEMDPISQHPQAIASSSAPRSSDVTGPASTIRSTGGQDVHSTVGFGQDQTNLPIQNPIDNRRKRTRQKNTLSFFDPNTKKRWFRGSFLRYIAPEYIYPPVPTYRHRDAMGRVSVGPQRDCSINVHTGRIRNVYVQATDEVRKHAQPHSSTWRRTHIRRVAPTSITLAGWPFSNVGPDPALWTETDLAKVCGKWFLASIGLMFTLFFAGGIGEVRNSGCYEGLPYKHWRYLRTYRNMKENHPLRSSQHWSAAVGNQSQMRERALRPRKLCFLTESGSPGRSHTVEDTDGLPPVDYMFIAYTSHHFPDAERQRQLLEIAEAATRNAGLGAFWIGLKCLPGLELNGINFNPEVHLINDIVRCCNGLIIALPAPSPFQNGAQTWRDLLVQWGRRMWTFPEALLSPGQEINVYVYGQSLGEPYHCIPKSQFAEYAWEDAAQARQLMDHFLGSAWLSKLEFAKVAVECLLRRAKMDEGRDGRNSKLLLGDMAYCYQGLHRRRPMVDSSDTEFEVFAKESFANDSDQLLERMINIFPMTDGHWFTINEDAWGVEPWDIVPTCQVAAVDEHAVLLDGCRGALIRWKGFKRVRYVSRWTWKKLGAAVMLRFNIIILLVSAFFIPGGVATIIFVVSLMTVFASPKFVQLIYGGKIWNTQAWLFGFEGYMDIDTIERTIFGNCDGRFSWSISGSTLSAHKEGKDTECVGVDPTEDPKVWARVQRAAKSGVNEEKIFTLVDTNTMTVTLFAAVRPPTAVLICGVEGGMQRAVLCSYDWTTGTMYRETVIRMETTVLNRMSRIPRVRFGFRRPKVQEHNSEAYASPPHFKGDSGDIAINISKV